MQVDGTTYGVIPDTFNTILNNYLIPLQNTFPNATSPNDPIYTLAYVTATQDQILQSALASLWNAINANTAQGVGLDILASTVLNLTRKGLTPSSCGITLEINPIYSSLVVQVTVTVVSTTGLSLPIDWTVSGSASPTAPYKLYAIYPITAPGVYYVTVFSTDTSTPIPSGSITTATPAVTGLTLTVTNLSTAVLGSLTIPTTWAVTASSLGAKSPTYSLNSPETFKKGGTYNVIVYSQDVTTPVFPIQLNTASDSFPYPAGFPTPSGTNQLKDVFNKYEALLGLPPETDAQFNSRRRTYLNVDGSTYYGLEKAILDLKVPALESIFIAETITDDYNASICIIKATVVYTGTPIVVPVGWTVHGTTVTSAPYKTDRAYTFDSSGDKYIPVFSLDEDTVVPIGDFTTADSPFPTDITAVTNLNPSITQLTLGLGKRGYTVYLKYPTIPYSNCQIQITVTAVVPTGPYYIPIGWTVSGFSTTSPYKTNQSYIVTAPGVYLVDVESIDVTTAVPAGSFTGGDAVTGLTFTVTNPAPATLGNSNPGEFDTNDLYLQQIAQTCFNYHAFGTQFYAAPYGATTFTVQTPYSGYTSPVILNPFQTIQVSCNLLMIYNSDPRDAGYSNGVFDTTIIPGLQTQIQQIINQYFLSKTLPTDLIYSINELSEILQNTFSGIVALIGNGSTIFSFGQISPLLTGRVFLQKVIGSNFNLDISNFNFNVQDKDTL